MKALEHRPYTVNFSKNIVNYCSVHVLEVVRHQELTFQLSLGAETYPDETTQLDVTHPAASFGKIGRYRYRSPTHL